MKLKLISAAAGTDHFIVFRSGGSSYLSSKLAKEMLFEFGGNLGVLQDETNPEDYYICKYHEGIAVRNYTSKHKSTFEFTARSLARDLAWKFGIDHKCVKIHVGPRIKYKELWVYPLITAPFKQSTYGIV